MESDRQQSIHLEVTVPHIHFSRHSPTPVPNPALEQQATDQAGVESEQVRLVSLAQQSDGKSLRSEEWQQSVGESSSHLLHSVPFQVVRINQIPLPEQGQDFLCQILRQHSALPHRTSTKVRAAQPSVTDELAFSVEFRHTASATETETRNVVDSRAAPTPVPGLSRIVIYLNSEGTPDSYSIDGSEM